MNDLPDMGGARWIAALARELAEQPDRAAVIQRLVEFARQATGCSAAVVAQIAPSGELLYRPGTDPALSATLSAISISTAEGSTWQALRDRRVVRVDDLATEQRWLAYTTQVRQQTPIRSVLAHCLTVSDVVLGVMLLYSVEPNFFTDSMLEFTTVYADHAAIALASVSAHERSESLETALRSNREIGMAMGILMAPYHLTEQAAFDALRVASQHRHRKLRAIAADTVFSGEGPAGLKPAQDANP